VSDQEKFINNIMFRRRKDKDKRQSLPSPVSGDNAEMWYNKPPPGSNQSSREISSESNNVRNASSPARVRETSQDFDLRGQQQHLQQHQQQQQQQQKLPPSPFQAANRYPIPNTVPRQSIRRENDSFNHHAAGAVQNPAAAAAAESAKIIDKNQGLFSLLLRGNDWTAANQKIDDDPMSTRIKDSVVMQGQKTSCFPLHLAVCVSAPVRTL
jgi:hypothetical protein